MVNMVVVFWPLDLRGHIRVIWWSGVRRKINRTAQSCSSV